MKALAKDPTKKKKVYEYIVFVANNVTIVRV
jgi:hypothetical protein